MQRIPFRQSIKIVALLTLVFMALVACQPVAPASAGDAAAPAADSGGGKPLVALVYGVKGDGFYITMEAGLRAKAEELGVDITLHTTEGSGRRSWLDWLGALWAWLFLFLLIVIFSVASGGIFFTPFNLQNILANMSILTIIAINQTLWRFHRRQQCQLGDQSHQP